MKRYALIMVIIFWICVSVFAQRGGIYTTRSATVEPASLDGEMLFWDSSVTKWTCTEDTELFWDDINKRLGIGTNEPAVNLQLGDVGGGHKQIIIHADGDALILKQDVAGDDIYQAWYTAGGVRRGFFGYAQGSNDVLILSNETGSHITILGIDEDDVGIEDGKYLILLNDPDTTAGKQKGIAFGRADSRIVAGIEPHIPAGGGGHLDFYTAATDDSLSVAMRIDQDGSVLINDTANTKMAKGLTINQGDNDDEVLAFKSSDVGHSLEDLTEADTYGFVRKASDDLGGLYIVGVSDGDAIGSILQGTIGSGNPTDSIPAVVLRAHKFNLTMGVADLANAETILAVQNGTTTKVAVLGDGSFVSLGTYSKDVGATTRDLLVDNAGLIGYQASSLRYKKNVQDMGNLSNSIYDLRPVSFDWKKSGTKDYGLIAEEVAEAMPTVITFDENGRPETVEYVRLIPFLLNELQKQQKRIGELTARIEALETNDD